VNSAGTGQAARSRLGSLLWGYRELLTVLAAAGLGLGVQAPLAWLAAR
jgi:hypothetical protein